MGVTYAEERRCFHGVCSVRIYLGRYWVSYVETITVSSRTVSWKYFPGYNKILHAFLAEMKSRTLANYS